VPASETWRLNGQITNVTQWHQRFRSPYSGANSLQADGRTEETTDLTLFAGLRWGRNVELWINPEIDQGFGLGNTLGVAGFPSGAAYKVGANRPYLRLQRAFARYTLALGGSAHSIDATTNQLAGVTGADNIVLTVGKFAAVDVFDVNRYAHDPRGDFLNWSVIDGGAFDYAADSWGYTYGTSVELTQGSWTWRGGVFQLSDEPNGKVTGLHLDRRMLVAELERRHEWQGHAGKIKLLAFTNRGAMGAYRDALTMGIQTAMTPDVSRVRRVQSRAGLVLNIEQALSDSLGAFARLSGNDGSKEAFEFTEINRSMSAGLSLQGSLWQRSDDTVGVAAAVNHLSGAARDYFAAGGLGILIGDGKLNYGSERIVETYYAARLLPKVVLTLNYQHVANPAYNTDRGPVSIYGLRLHADF
jgi:high affinity Mn2+ porin